MQSLFSQQSLENFSFTECCLRQLASCHQSRKNQETSARCSLVSYLSPVGFSFFMTQKSSQTGWGAGSALLCWLILSATFSALFSGLFLQRQISSIGAWPAGVWRSWRSNEPCSVLSWPALLWPAVRVSSLQKWVLLCSLPRVSDWRKDKLMSTSVSRLATAG